MFFKKVPTESSQIGIPLLFLNVTISGRYDAESSQKEYEGGNFCPKMWQKVGKSGKMVF